MLRRRPAVLAQSFSALTRAEKDVSRAKATLTAHISITPASCFFKGLYVNRFVAMETAFGQPLKNREHALLKKTLGAGREVVVSTTGIGQSQSVATFSYNLFGGVIGRLMCPPTKSCLSTTSTPSRPGVSTFLGSCDPTLLGTGQPTTHSV